MSTHDAHTPHPFDDADIRLIVTDMDGTLLDADGAVPDRLWGQLDRLRARGIVFAPASGRQVAALERIFARALEGMVLIGDNGSMVVRDGVEVSSVTIDRAPARRVVEAVRAYVAGGGDAGLVVCGKDRALVERGDPGFLAAVRPYVQTVAVVDDVLAEPDAIVKFALYDVDDSAPLAASLADVGEGAQVIVTGHHWVDVIAPGVDKGVALTALQAELGVTPAQTAVFGDFLNDLPLFEHAEHSFAMANAHPLVRERARHGAASNVDHGVVEAIDRLLA